MSSDGVSEPVAPFLDSDLASLEQCLDGLAAKLNRAKMVLPVQMPQVRADLEEAVALVRRIREASEAIASQVAEIAADHERLAAVVADMEALAPPNRKLGKFVRL